MGLLDRLFEPSQENQAMHGMNTGYPKYRRRSRIGDGTEINREGYVDKIYFSTRMPCCDVKLVTGDVLKFLPFPGGTLDEITGFLHGDFVQPKEGQRVIISFSEGDRESPYISELIWRPANSLYSIKYKVEFPIKYNEGDIIRGHKSGGIQKFSDFLGPNVFTGFDILVDPLGSASVSNEMAAICNYGPGSVITPGLPGVPTIPTIVGPPVVPGVPGFSGSAPIVGPPVALPPKPAVVLGDGGGIGIYGEVAVAYINQVFTYFGPSPILHSQDTQSTSPRKLTGTSILG